MARMLPTGKVQRLISVLERMPRTKASRRSEAARKRSFLRRMAADSKVMESIVILDDEEEEEEKACSRASSSSSQLPVDSGSARVSVPVPTHITTSPFASAQKDSSILRIENQKLFMEFVEHCRTLTQDHPEVITFLQAKHAKVSPDFLASVELRNTLGRCLTRAQAGRSKTFVYINELCTVLKQHAAKKRLPVTPAPSAAEGDPGGAEQPQEGRPTSPEPGEQKKTVKASKRQIAYLENLLKVYYEEIRRLQEKEISLDDMVEEDCSYIQEHKLKRKMMKIYDKLCELKGCNTLTGRVIEQKVSYTGTRYPEINKKIERFINSLESRQNPPDYADILRLVRRVNERHGLLLSQKQVTQIAQDSFRETGNRLQERRHLDMVFNFGSHLTDEYKPALDPALSDPVLARKLRSNRELALTRLEEVVSKYALHQDDSEEQERKKRQEKLKKEKAPDDKQEATPAENETKGEEEDEGCESDGEVAESEGQEDDEDEEEEVSSDPDIEEELTASQSQEGADEEDGGEEEEEATDESDIQQQWGAGVSTSPEGVDMNGEEDSRSVSSCQGHGGEERPPSVREEGKDGSTPPVSPSQSEAVDPDKCLLTVASKSASSDHLIAASPSSGAEVCLPSSILDTEIGSCSSLMANPDSLPSSPAMVLSNQHSLSPPHDSRSANCSPLPLSPQAIMKTPSSRKRKRMTGSSGQSALNGSHKRACADSDDDIPLDMGVVSSSPQQADSTRADSPCQELVSSSQCTPPPKRNKVNVATQCDPDEVIVLSDSD
ncbi:death domain-associated protein 6 isoform X1 [Paramormyrops kingsleyae]|uniref:death domain-associated protein 6 isoform X1 n=2 Tax=Paramormyrops kingsleyae TaxID=1676925 RepID=UPI003B96A0A7